MTPEQLFENIGLSESARERVGLFLATCDRLQVDAIVRDYREGRAEEAYKTSYELFGDAQGGIPILACQLLAVAQLRENYYQYEEQFGDVFTPTMKCFPRFLKENLERLGVEIFDKGWWSWRQVGGKLFRLGALEFEYREDGDIGIHIPSDAAFTPEAVDESLALARAFTKQYFPAFENADYACDSWLLSPALEQLLPPTSNIIRFRKRFEIVKFVPDHRGYKFNLFGCPKDTDPSQFVENTSLQRAAKAFVLGGGQIGCAKGIMKK